ncbi:MAG: hypothetical protein CENE_03704 [Candidatus Celerinatantimonas neptuna]|nr:MAG: hypothetical protein CENE_03704 [Candidatus Celerinatantimonas neptuna]
MYYLCSLGCNIKPQQHVPQAIDELIQFTSPITCSSFIYTIPVDMNSANHFVNGLFYFTNDLPAKTIKTHFNHLEIVHGRDRQDPLSSIKDRVLDLDILASSNNWAAIACASLPSYLLELHSELIFNHCVNHQTKFHFNIGKLQLGHRTTTINRNPGPG